MTDDYEDEAMALHMAQSYEADEEAVQRNIARRQRIEAIRQDCKSKFDLGTSDLAYLLGKYDEQVADYKQLWEVDNKFIDENDALQAQLTKAEAIVRRLADVSVLALQSDEARAVVLRARQYIAEETKP